MSTPRLPPQPREEWNDDTRNFFEFCEGKDARENGSVSNLVNTFAYHPKLMLAWMRYNGRLLAAPKIPARIRELVILRLADRYRCEYEWLQHIDIGRELGLSSEHFDAVKVGPEAAIWSDLERNALRAADEMATEYKVREETWKSLEAEFDSKQMLEFLFIVGTYSMLAWILNSIGIVPEAHAGKGTTDYLSTTLKPGRREDATV
jgi:4-carboxymuconolactone decarboxylase